MEGLDLKELIIADIQTKQETCSKHLKREENSDIVEISGFVALMYLAQASLSRKASPQPLAA